MIIKLKPLIKYMKEKLKLISLSKGNLMLLKLFLVEMLRVPLKLPWRCHKTLQKEVGRKLDLPLKLKKKQIKRILNVKFLQFKFKELLLKIK